MRAAADTNILVYAAGVNDEPRRRMATDLLAALYAAKGVLPAQALAELHHVLVRKYRRSAADAMWQIGRWSLGFEVAPTDSDCIAAACRLVDKHGLQTFDAVIVASVAQAGCRVLFSEDMQHDAVFDGVTIVNPFTDARHPAVRALLKPT
jgi:predicted nucleic acid-binding protein